jgi:hypothetical protein
MEIDLSNAQFDTPHPSGGQIIDLNSASFDKSGDDAGPVHAFAYGVSNAVPAGQKITSAIGAVIAKAASPITGDTRSLGELYDQAQADTAATAKANPKSSLAGTAAGVISSLPLMGAAGKAAGAAVDATPGISTAAGYLSRLGAPAEDAGILSRAGNLAIRSGKSAALAAPLGALYGGAAAPYGQMQEGALEGGKVAAEVGAAIPVAGAGLGVGADAVGAARGYLNKNTVSGQAEAAAAENALPGANSVAMGKVIKRFNADFTDPAQRQAAIDAYLKNPDIGLAEAAGKNTKNLAEGAAQFPSGQSQAEDYLVNRAAGSKDRIARTFADHVSSNQDYFGTLDDVVATGRAKAAPLYDEAYAANKAVVSPDIDKILDTPAGKQALAAARTKMMNDQSLMGLPNKELGDQMREAVKMGEMADPQSRGVATGLNMRSLDYVKRALDDQIGAAYRAGENDNGRILTGLKNSLLNAMDEADVTAKAGPNSLKAEGGAYARARSVSGDYLSNAKSLEDGKNFKSFGAPEEIKAHFHDLGDTQKEAFKAGMVRAIKDQMNNAVDGADMYKKVFGNQTQRDKIAAVLNPTEFDLLSKNLQAEKNLFDFKAQVMGNSRTAQRTISAEEFANGGEQLMKDMAAGGPKYAALAAGKRWVMSLFGGLSDRTAGQVSKILYETDPAKKLEILKSIQGNAALEDAEKKTAIRAYFSVDRLFKDMAQKVPVISAATGENK